MCSCVEIVKHTTPVARKEYRCEAAPNVREWVQGGMWVEDKHKKVTFADLRKIVVARQENFRILKGAKYVRQVNKMDGTIYTFKCRQDMMDICSKFDLWGEC